MDHQTRYTQIFVTPIFVLCIMILPIAFIDTFTSVPFKGNPTAVCLAEYELENHVMLALAKEINYPVTAFIRQRNDYHQFDIRYFTVTTEIPACGHATLAAARMLMDRNAEMQRVQFFTAGKMTIETILEGSIIMMTYPAYTIRGLEFSQNVLSSLQLKDFQTAGYCSELETLFVEIKDPHMLRTLQPDYERLLASDNTIKEVVVTSVSDSQDFDYLLRSFCPWIGINEDPVTGSVHSVLANFWKKRLRKDTLRAYQASPRGGELLIKAFEGYTQIGGNSVVILRGELTV